MKSRHHEVLAVAVALLSATAPLACRTQSSSQPPQTATTTNQWDAGVPPTVPSKRKGIIVPGGVGMGAGPSGSTANGGSTPALGTPGASP
jgi:hypothetical protein